MRRENHPIAICVVGEKLLSRRTRRQRIDAEARTLVWITKLQRMVHEVGAENRFTPAAFDADHELARRVSVRGLNANARRNSISVVDQFRLPGCEYRQHAVGDEIPCALQVGDAGARSPVLPLGPRHQIARFRKRRHPLTVLEPRVPAYMIDVQMRAQHQVHIIWRDSSLAQLLEPAPSALVEKRPLPLLVIAAACIQ